MSSGIDYQVHRLVEVKGRRGMKIPDYSNPKAYIRLAAKEGTVYIQQGKILYEDGTQIPVSKIPDWLMTEIKKSNPVTLREAGFKVEPILKELEAEAKAKSDTRRQNKLAAAKEKAKAAAKLAQKGRSAHNKPVPDPEPEDLGLEEEPEEEAEEEITLDADK